MDDIIARRQFDPLYMWLDIGFLVVFAALLLVKKKYVTLIIGVLFGFVYFAVDYGIFHLVFRARTISEGYSLFWVLLWMSMSYGFTNFVWIWLWISKDKRLLEWSALILFWWLCAPMIAATFGTSEIPKGKGAARQYPLSARHRRSGTVRLGGRPAARRDSQRGIRKLCG